MRREPSARIDLHITMTRPLFLSVARVAIAAWLVTATLDLYALPWRLRMQDGSKPGPSAMAVLQARRVDAPADAIRLEVPIPADGALPITEGTWEVTVQSQDVWVPTLYVTATQTADLIARPAAQLRARLNTGAEPLPQSVRIIVIPADAQSQREPLLADVSCPVVELEMRCVVPAGTYDLRINADGYMPELRWDVRLPARSVTTVDPIAFAKGAAVIGSVIKAGRGVIPPDARVTLAPVAMSVDRGRAVILQARPNAKGIFRFASVPPGEYMLTASAKDLASDSRSIVVVANRTAELNAPLMLDVPKRVRATILPSTDPAGKNWALELRRQRPGTSGSYDLITSASAEPDGTWEHKGLRNARYLLVVSRADGSGQWASVPFELNGADLDLPIAIAPVPVAGAIRYGDRAIAAALHFGGEWSDARQVLHSDERGKFEGLLPPSGKELWDLYIESDTPPIRRTLTDVRGRKDAEGRLQFDLELPATAIIGKVFDAAGKAVENAIVNLRAARGGRTDQVTTAHDGSFQFSGVAPGDYRMVAEAYLLMSEVIDVRVEEEDSAPVRIVLKDIQQVKGRVTVDGKVPVIGARLHGLSPNSAWRDFVSGKSNESGAFILIVPPDTPSLDMVITSPGFATVIGRVAVRTDRPMLIATAQYGGSLIVDSPDLPAVRIVREGAQFHPRLIASLIGGTASTDGKRLRTTLPALEPGHYSVCLGTRCEGGYVPPHGTLTLSLNQP
jgi:hypothetical protein